jgi:archaellum component FlaF (FlaF/FlaG flagellin family)
MRRYSKDSALAADADNSGNLCMLNMQIDCVLRIICTFVVFVILYVSREHSNGRINTAYFSKNSQCISILIHNEHIQAVIRMTVAVVVLLLVAIMIVQMLQ